MKVCSRCGTEKDGSEFYKNSNVCKNCKSKYNVQYFKNPIAKQKRKRKFQESTKLVCYSCGCCDLEKYFLLSDGSISDNCAKCRKSLKAY